MGDVRRWSVTYTKHTKQKRKVYQDGFLELHNSISKIMLYDDCEKLLDSRIVKKDDVVKDGETLAFDAYLVDVGDLEGDHKPIPNLNFQGRDKKASEKARVFHGKKFKDSSVSVEDRKTNSGKNKVSSSNLSPSQKIIREFKKNEMNKYGAPRNCLDTTKHCYVEWQVLFTTQITQKAKKYHDGILRVATCGSQGRQVTLYDLSRRLLDSRFLKKDEVIESGESLGFDGHLVDVGEPEVDHKPLMDLKAHGTNCTAGGKTGLHIQKGSHNSCVGNENSGSSDSMTTLNFLKAAKIGIREWHALYTTQIIQKAKKYHSGIFRLTPSSSYQMQATLLNEDGTILTRKYLMLSEVVRSGSKFKLSNYLVELGEPLTSLKGEPPQNSFSGKEMESSSSPLCIDNFKLGHRVPTNEPLRDANEILSILRKSMTQEDSVPRKSASAERRHSSQSSDFIQFDIQNQVERHLLQDPSCERHEADNHDEKTTERHSLVVHDLAIEIVKAEDSENRGSQLRYIAPSSFSHQSEASDFSSPNSNAECTDKSILRSVSSIKEPRAKLDCPDNFQPPNESASYDGSYRNMEGGTVELMSSKASSSCHCDRFSEELNAGTSPQHNEESTGILSDEGLAGGLANSCGYISHDSIDIGRQSSNVHKSPSKMDEIPSFDLGF